VHAAVHAGRNAGNILLLKGWCRVERTIQAVYANGVLRPLAPVDFLDENRQVTLTVTLPERRRPLENWVGGLSDADAGEMRRVIEAEFEQVDADDWK
jgi:hypothetical protein